jgi:hypothetical protein
VNEGAGQLTRDDSREDCRHARYPPEALKTSPVQYDAAGEARNAMT